MTFSEKKQLSITACKVRMGVIGACTSICIAYIVRSVSLNIIYHKVLPLDIPAFIKNCYLRMMVPVLLTILCGWGLNGLIADGGWLIFLIKAGITAALYLLFTLLIGLNQAEKARILGMIKKIVK